MKIRIIKSVKSDLGFLKTLENCCFSDGQKLPLRALKYNYESQNRDVWIAKIYRDKQWVNAGTIVLHRYKNSLRLFSIAVLPEYRHLQVGGNLMDFVIRYGKEKQFKRITLEFMKSNKHLLHWYEQFGFTCIEDLNNYYGENIDASRMSLDLHKNINGSKKENIIIIEGKISVDLVISENTVVITAKEYIKNKKIQKIKNARVFNLCNSYKYQGLGYYVSLLASARDHRVIPNVTSLGDYENMALIKSLSFEMDGLIQKSLEKCNESKVCLNVYFGQTENSRYKQLASKLYMIFETPLFQVSFHKNGKWNIVKVNPLSFSKELGEGNDFLMLSMNTFFAKKRFYISRFKNYKYDFAVLVNPKEKKPPSNEKALQKFKSIAEKKGIFVEFITKNDINRICEFDALFIRETTSVDDHTYKIARTAYAEGLVVIDDPWSILRCSNKIYLYERMQLNGVLMPDSKVLMKGNNVVREASEMGFPIVLKKPDGAFSVGVSKVNNKNELTEALNVLFKKSELVIAQKFLPSEFDWRIGILNNEPLFACRYYMAKGHWQIYNWKEHIEFDGDAEAFELDRVPSQVLRTAIKAASLMGDGLYGVDLKEIDGRVYLIEVNDNPNIDHGIEDAYYKDEIYSKVIDSLINRIEVSRNISKFAVSDPI